MNLQREFAASSEKHLLGGFSVSARLDGSTAIHFRIHSPSVGRGLRAPFVGTLHTELQSVFLVPCPMSVLLTGKQLDLRRSRIDAYD